ncbi:hypothetical protein FJZ48_00115 [Candidatus Uhrbacteria bacterium]|nr:hypothetical protein [Candidatus Uhrbacteria bacterium]
MDSLNALKELGLAEQESEIYLALLKIGGGTASQVAKDAGIKRTTVYAILKTLAQKGFVTMYFKRSKQFYLAEKPQRIASYFETKVKSFTQFIPQLESLERKQAQTLGLRFIETVDELKQFYTRILSEYKNKQYRALGNSNTWQGLATEFFVQYRHDRGANNIRTKILVSADSVGVNPTDPRLLRDVRILPENYSFKSTIDIYDDKVLIVSPELTSLAVVIAIPAMVDVFRSMFDMLWEFVGPTRTLKRTNST